MDVSSDLRIVWRHRRARPLLPLLAVGVLILGIGSSTAVLGLVYAALLRPLPYPHSGELVVVSTGFPNVGLTSMGLSGPEATELGTLTTGFAAVGFGYEAELTVNTAEAARAAAVAYVSAGLLRALNPTPAFGRLFDATDDRPNGPRQVIVANGFWRGTLSADPTILGRSLTVDGRPYTVIGVLPAHVDFMGRPVDLWIPLQYDTRAPGANRANHIFTVIGRQRADLTRAGLDADIARAVARWAELTHEFHVPDARFHPLSLAPLTDTVRGPIRRAALVLVGAVALVLIISAANAATLLIAGADLRQTEMAVRAALGAGPWHLFRLHLVDAVALSSVAMAGGVLGALWAGHGLTALAPPELSNLDLTVPIWQTTCLAAAVTTAVALVCAVAPFSRLRFSRLASALSAESRTGTATAERQTSRRVLVGMEVALALALLSSAALMIESAWKLSHVELGFRPAGAFHAGLTLPASRYDERDRIDAFYDAVIARVRGTPGVMAVGALSGLPPNRRPNNTSFTFDGQLMDPHAGAPPMQFLDFASAGAFAALGITLKEGRPFTDDDRSDSQPVAILNEQAARIYFPGGSAVGKRLRMFAKGLPWLTVIGVVGDVRQHGLNRDVGTEVFLPVRQANNTFGNIMTHDLNLVVRAAQQSVAVGAIRDAVRRADPTVAISAIESMDARVGDSIASTRFLTSVLVAFAAIALLLSASGVSGVVMHAVSTRTREIGLRRALGAGTSAIVGMVARQAVLFVGGGIFAGGVGAVAAMRALEPFVFHAVPQNPGRVGLVALTLVLTAVIACAMPLLRAMRIDPAVALRQ